MPVMLTQEQELLQGTIREFAINEISSVASKIDSEAKVPGELFEKLPALGLYGITVPSELGGAGADFLSLLLAVEELSKVSGSVGARVSFHNAVCDLIITSTNERLKSVLLPKLITGTLAAFSIDPKSTITLKDENGSMTLEGTSEFVMNADTAQIFLILATAKDGSKSFVCFQCSEAQGEFEVEEPKKLMGMRGTGTCKISCNGLKLSDRAAVFEKNATSSALESFLATTRLLVAAQALGIAQASLDEAVRYANERSQFNTKIGRFFAVQDFMAQDEISIQSSRSVTYGAAPPSNSPEKVRDSCIAKISASNAAVQSARHSIRILSCREISPRRESNATLH
jgi:alkylation response protein AidB-like acyl-CoA dehydrogenase